MSTTVFILILTTAGKVKEVTTALKHLDELQSVDDLRGLYDAFDIIVTLEAEDLTAINHIVKSKIDTIPSVSRTVVCTTLNKFGE